MSMKSRFFASALTFSVAVASQTSFATESTSLPANAPTDKTIGQLDQVFTFHDAMPPESPSPITGASSSTTRNGETK